MPFNEALAAIHAANAAHGEGLSTLTAANQPPLSEARVHEEWKRTSKGGTRVSAHKVVVPPFNERLEMGVGELKRLAKRVEKPQEKASIFFSLFVRDALTVAFAVFFITVLTSIFGYQASSCAIGLFVMILCLRYAAFNFTPRSNVIVIALSICILTLAPLFVAQTSPWVRFIVNTISLMSLMVLTADNPRMGNGGTYGFIYCFSAGMMYDVQITYVDIQLRVLLMFISFIIATHIYWRHRFIKTDRTLKDALGEISLSNEKTQYHVRAALGISLVVLLCELLGFKRILWVGLVANSMLTPYGLKVRDRMWWRIAFVGLGTAIFYLTFPMIPPALYVPLSITMSLCCGMCSKYYWTQMFNTFGALLVSISVLNLEEATFWRLVDNACGAIFAFLFSLAFAHAIDAYTKHHKDAEKNKFEQDPLLESELKIPAGL